MLQNSYQRLKRVGVEASFHLNTPSTAQHNDQLVTITLHRRCHFHSDKARLWSRRFPCLRCLAPMPRHIARQGGQCNIVTITELLSTQSTCFIGSYQLLRFSNTSISATPSRLSFHPPTSLLVLALEQDVLLVRLQWCEAGAFLARHRRRWPNWRSNTARLYVGGGNP